MSFLQLNQEQRKNCENLKQLAKNGVLLYIDDKLATPASVTKECMLREENAYMADYVTDEKGDLAEIRFHKVKHN